MKGSFRSGFFVGVVLMLLFAFTIKQKPKKQSLTEYLTRYLYTIPDTSFVLVDRYCLDTFTDSASFQEFIKEYYFGQKFVRININVDSFYYKTVSKDPLIFDTIPRDPANCRLAIIVLVPSEDVEFNQAPVPQRTPYTVVGDKNEIGRIKL